MISYIDLGREGKVTTTDMEQSAQIGNVSSTNLLAYVGKKCAIRNQLTKLTLSLDTEVANQVIINVGSQNNLSTMLPRIESAVVSWFSPERKGLSNVRLRYMLVDNVRVYINSFKIILD